jgi:hypothetical protein
MKLRARQALFAGEASPPSFVCSEITLDARRLTMYNNLEFY